jgi:phage shock protein C
MKRLYRSQTDRKIAGIMGGLGELYNIDPNLLRLLAVLLFLVSGFFPVLFTYIIAWIILPDGKPAENERRASGSEDKTENNLSGAATSKKAGTRKKTGKQTS